MQNNEPRTRLEPSATYVARDYALHIVMMLQDLLGENPDLFDTFMTHVTSGLWPGYVNTEWLYLVKHNLIRQDNVLEERVRDITRMTVTGSTGSWTIDPTVFG